MKDAPGGSTALPNPIAGPLTRELPKLDVYRVLTYSLATRGEVGADAATFGAVVAEVYAEPRGWLRSHRRFTRVATGGDFTVVLAQASLTPNTVAQYSM